MSAESQQRTLDDARSQAVGNENPLSAAFELHLPVDFTNRSHEHSAFGLAIEQFAGQGIDEMIFDPVANTSAAFEPIADTEFAQFLNSFRRNLDIDPMLGTNRIEDTAHDRGEDFPCGAPAHEVEGHDVLPDAIHEFRTSQFVSEIALHGFDDLALDFVVMIRRQNVHAHVLRMVLADHPDIRREDDERFREIRRRAA